VRFAPWRKKAAANGFGRKARHRGGDQRLRCRRDRPNGQAAAVTASGQLEDRFWDGAGFLVPMAGTALALITLVTLRSRLATRPTSRTVARGVGHRVPVAVD